MVSAAVVTLALVVVMVTVLEIAAAVLALVVGLDVNICNTWPKGA